jgi:hypothetical protein
MAKMYIKLIKRGSNFFVFPSCRNASSIKRQKIIFLGKKSCRVAAKIVLNEINCLKFMKNYLFVIELMRNGKDVRRHFSYSLRKNFYDIFEKC